MRVVDDHSFEIAICAGLCNAMTTKLAGEIADGLHKFLLEQVRPQG
jgi:hypothetical protein